MLYDRNPHRIEREGTDMLIIEDDSVYEIDEECLKTRNVPKECKVREKLLKEHKKRAGQRQDVEK